MLFAQALQIPRTKGQVLWAVGDGWEGLGLPEVYVFGICVLYPQTEGFFWMPVAQLVFSRIFTHALQLV